MSFSPIKKHQPKFLILYAFILFSLIACGTSVPDGVTPDAPATSTDCSYPSGNSDCVTPEPGDYPPVTPESTGTVEIRLNKPFLEGDIVVTGVGPPRMRVILVNMTLMGEELGSAVVDDDGTFRMDVDPLVAGFQYGLSADPESVGLTHEDIIDSDGSISDPRIGFFYDSFVILQQ